MTPNKRAPDGSGAPPAANPVDRLPVWAQVIIGSVVLVGGVIAFGSRLQAEANGPGWNGTTRYAETRVHVLPLEGGDKILVVASDGDEGERAVGRGSAIPSCS
ncbi:hypothetical protein [Deinococcus multiflagellatus]|uniref:Uncharacterized protein n=1 Tax=Deinococcus multiflagellatus TaxID=1656887 RepID=A0ABW1ZQY1_9DEIO